MRSTFGLVVVALLSVCWSVEAAPKAKLLGPIDEIKGVAPKQTAFKGSTWKKPVVLRSKKDVAKYFDEKEAAKIAKAVNFDKQFALAFIWQGSGGDRLTYAVAESFPEQIFFSVKLGLTDDLRQHTRVFALRSNVRWRVKK